MAKKPNRYVMSYNQATGQDVVVYANDLTEAEAKFEAGETVEEDPPQIKISIVCDKGHVADSLRDLANAIENDDIDTDDYEYEDAHCAATFYKE